MTALLRPCVLNTNMTDYACIWHLLFRGGGGVDSTGDEPRRDWEGKMWANDGAAISLINEVWLPRRRPNFMHFLRRVSMGKVISVTRDKQSQSAVSVWATALMWQIWERWRVRDRRGTQRDSEGRGADPQSRLGNWLQSPDTSPRRSAATLTRNTHRLQRERRAAAGLLPPSLCRCVSIPNVWICLPSCICTFRPCAFVCFRRGYVKGA